MGQNDTPTSLYKAGATIMLNACKSYFTCMEHLRDVQRRTDADLADAAEQCASKLKHAEDMAQCSSWQQQASAEQIGRWNQYLLELIQIASESQAISQTAMRDGLDQVQRVYASFMMHIPAMPNMPLTAAEPAPISSRKSNSQRAAAH